MEVMDMCVCTNVRFCIWVLIYLSICAFTCVYLWGSGAVGNHMTRRPGSTEPVRPHLRQRGLSHAPPGELWVLCARAVMIVPTGWTIQPLTHTHRLANIMLNSYKTHRNAHTYSNTHTSWHTKVFTYRHKHRPIQCPYPFIYMNTKM